MQRCNQKFRLRVRLKFLKFPIFPLKCWHSKIISILFLFKYPHGDCFTIPGSTWRLFYRPTFDLSLQKQYASTKGLRKELGKELERNWKGLGKELEKHSILASEPKRELEKDSIFGHSEHMNKWRFQELGKNGWRLHLPYSRQQVWLGSMGTVTGFWGKRRESDCLKTQIMLQETLTEKMAKAYKKKCFV